MSGYVDLRDAVQRIVDEAASSRVRWLRIIAAGGASVNGAFIEPDEAQVAIGVLDWIGPRLSNALANAAAPDFQLESEYYRHVKRGTVYEVVGRAELQVATHLRPGEGQTLVVYQGDDGKLWAREETEFLDGRFELISSQDNAA